MKDVFAVKKVSPALRLCIDSSRVVLSINESQLTDDTFRSQLLDRPDEILDAFKALTPQGISQWKHEQICALMEDADYDPAVAARESESGLFLDLHAALMDLRSKMHQEHQANRCLSPTASFLVAVDGSRQSYLAFELAARLRRQGQLAIVNIDEEHAASIQLPQISSEFITQEYKAHCARLQLPTNRVTIACDSNDKLSVAEQLLHVVQRDRVDFLVLGSHGKGGPSIDQVRHVPWEVLRSTPSIPVVIVPPAPVNSVISKQYVFVVAVDGSAITSRCLNAVLKLMRPTDLLRIVHFYEKPTIGENDTEPFAWCHEIIKDAQVSGVVDIEPVKSTSTIAESLQDYLSKYGAAYLVLGLNGNSADSEPNYQKNGELMPQSVPNKSEGNQIGRLASAMLFSPRCALCLCP